MFPGRTTGLNQSAENQTARTGEATAVQMTPQVQTTPQVHTSPDLSQLTTRSSSHVVENFRREEQNPLAEMLRGSSAVRITNAGGENTFIVETKNDFNSSGGPVSLNLLTVNPKNGSMQTIRGISVDDASASAVSPDGKSYIVATGEGLLGYYSINRRDFDTPVRSVGCCNLKELGIGDNAAESIEFVNEARIRVNFPGRSVTIELNRGSLQPVGSEKSVYGQAA